MVDIKFKQYHIVSTKYGYSLYKMRLDDNKKPVMVKDKTSKTGLKISEIVIGYFQNITQTLEAIERNLILTGNKKIDTIEKIIKEEKKITKELENFIENKKS